MKLIPITFAGTLVAFALTAHAEDMPGLKMDDMQGMQMQAATQQAPAANA